MRDYAWKLETFKGAAREGFSVGARSSNPITDKVLIMVFEEGAATAEQAGAMLQFLRDAVTEFPHVKIVFQFVP